MIPREGHFPRINEILETLLRAEGLELFGSASLFEPDLQRAAGRAAAEYRGWIGEGRHGGMHYLARHADVAYAPQHVLPACGSVIVVGLNYYQDDRSEPPPETGRVARYAWGRDYHNALGKRLRRVVRRLRESHPDEQFRSFVDASPLSERFFAEHAGLGFTARNTLTMSSAYGSWFFLGEILTTLALPSTTAGSRHGACPSSCFRCGAACPTGALHDHHRIDARRCISYLTIEHRGSIDEQLRPLMGDWVFGCDRCQEPCPLNVRAQVTAVKDFQMHRVGPRLRLTELLAIDEEEVYRRRFGGTPLLRPGRDAMVRNACIAAANVRGVSLLPRLNELTRDQSALVREHARWAVDRLVAG